MNLKNRMIRLPGKIKGLFFVTRMDRLTPIYLFHFLVNLAELSKWISKYKKDCPNDFYTREFNYSKRESLYEQVITNFKLDTNIDYLEFGVSKGASFRWWVNRIKNEEARFYGFDTFSGLPEDWGPFKKGDMANGNEPPKLNDNRHKFYQGLFQQTLIPFLNSYSASKRKVIHMDADIYSATLYVLTLITPFLKSGDIIFFDEFNVPLHEFKAFKEWSSSFYIKYKVLGAVNNFYQVAIEIK
jgi:O-methyltransferase